MEVEIDLRKSLHENVNDYYNRSKKAKKKLSGLGKAIKDTKKRIAELESKQQSEEKSITIKKQRKKEWYEKFHWFFSSNDYLIIAGKDAKSNEIVVKRHMDSGDIYFHANVHGAPHTIVKAKNNSAPDKTMEEAAEFAASYSKAWRDKVSAADVYSVLPKQVSKSAPSGEALASGAFMIYGERNWFRKTKLNFAIGVEKHNSNYRIISGPLSAVKKHTKNFVEVFQGDESKGALARNLKAKLEKQSKEKISLDLDEIIAMLPAGGLRV